VQGCRGTPRREKIEELAALVEETSADGVVVDNELTPEQTVGLESATGVRVLDRHRIVLAISAEQARTRRAQLQVELARLRYRLPRIRARSDEGALNRSIGSGTPLYDVRARIDELERKLADGMAIDEAGHDDRQTTATVADRLFATLETTTRRASLDGRDVLLTDTVGLLDDATLERRIDTLATAGLAESIRTE